MLNIRIRWELSFSEGIYTSMVRVAPWQCDTGTLIKKPVSVQGRCKWKSCLLVFLFVAVLIAVSAVRYVEW